MKVILFGATGMVGQGALRECLLDPEVQGVLAVGRSATGQSHEKLREIVHADLLDPSPIEDKLSGHDACFFCLGVSSAGMTEDAYSRVTYEITMAVAQTSSTRDVKWPIERHRGRVAPRRRECVSIRAWAISAAIACASTHVPAGAHPASAWDHFEDPGVQSALGGVPTPLAASEGALSQVRHHDR